MVAQFEANLGRLRTREGMAKARAKGRLNGKQPKLPLAAQKTIYCRYHDPDDNASLPDLAEGNSVGRSTMVVLWHTYAHSSKATTLACGTNDEPPTCS